LGKMDGHDRGVARISSMQWGGHYTGGSQRKGSKSEGKEELMGTLIPGLQRPSNGKQFKKKADLLRSIIKEYIVRRRGEGEPESFRPGKGTKRGPRPGGQRRI